MIYPVHEIFSSIQGEGHNVGAPTVFIRLVGCNLSCPYCDTDQPKEGKEMSSKEIADCVEMISHNKIIHWVCITGGEPTMHDLVPLVAAIRAKDGLVAIETNGTRQIERLEKPDWLTVSPKWPPGLDGTKQRSGNEIKVPISSDVSDADVKRALYTGLYEHWFLQPVDDENFKLNVDRAKSLAFETGARISGQLHKRLGVE